MKKPPRLNGHGGFSYAIMKADGDYLQRTSAPASSKTWAMISA